MTTTPTTLTSTARASSQEVLFVCWQHPDSRRFHVVGRLLYDPDRPVPYEFAYVRGAAIAAEGVRPLLRDGMG